MPAPHPLPRPARSPRERVRQTARRPARRATAWPAPAPARVAGCLDARAAAGQLALRPARARHPRAALQRAAHPEPPCHRSAAGPRRSPSEARRPRWRRRYAPHQNAEINSHCVHQPSAVQAQDRSCTTATTPEQEREQQLGDDRPEQPCRPRPKRRAASLARTPGRAPRGRQQQVEQAEDRRGEQPQRDESEQQQHAQQAERRSAPARPTAARFRCWCGTRPARPSDRCSAVASLPLTKRAGAASLLR